MANEIIILDPFNDGDDHVVVGGAIEASGSTLSGSDTLLRIYGKVFLGSVTVANVGQKPWPWHQANLPDPIEGFVFPNGASWEFSGASMAPGAEVNKTNTLIVWGDFEDDSCYVLTRREFEGIEDSSGGSLMSSASSIAKLMPQRYRLSIGSDSTNLGDIAQDSLLGDLVRKQQIALAFDEVHVNYEKPVWHGRASGNSGWTLRVIPSNGSTFASLSYESDLKTRTVLAKWTAPKWDFLGRNVLSPQGNQSSSCAVPLIVEPE